MRNEMTLRCRNKYFLKSCFINGKQKKIFFLGRNMQFFLLCCYFSYWYWFFAGFLGGGGRLSLQKNSPRFYFPTYICLVLVVVFCLAKIVCSALGWGMDVKTQNQTCRDPVQRGIFLVFAIFFGRWKDLLFGISRHFEILWFVCITM